MLLTVFMYTAITAFVFFSLRKAWQYAHNPLANRWELYPVPGEPGARRRHGGSYYEEAEWWTSPRQVSRIGQYKEMLKEMLFMKSLFINRKRFWTFSYAMHLGIYVLGLFTLFLLAGAATEMFGMRVASLDGVSSHPWAAFVYFATAVAGFSGAFLTACGSASLLVYRVSDKALRKYTAGDEYFNLFFILTAAVSGLVAWSTDPGFNYSRGVVIAMLSFTPVRSGVALMAHLLIFGALLIYIPRTKMSHYIGKYFAYHKVLWDNEPNLKGSALERIVEKNLANRPQDGWSSPHTKSTGAEES
ncbi:MAG: nitrate reductase gamma subunit [Desulfotomaculaceae bacterium]|nr:nitrate reductase gamma subunit [Desulfotomaculaceae bacterium]